MQPCDIQRLAEELKRGELSVDDFIGRISQRPTADLGEIQLDLDRRRRCGFPEVIFGQGKSLESLEKAFHALLADGVDVLATRISAEIGAILSEKFAAGRYNPVGRTFRIPRPSPNGEPQAASGHVAIVTAGASDMPVAEEARETALWMGHRVTLIQDVGVAGPHRLPARLPEFADADAIVVIAGMEGALPSVVGGYVDRPVVGVPTSVGYGANFSGVAALLSMLNSCAANVTVVNIDSGFKGAYVAGLIAAKISDARSRKSEVGSRTS